MQREIISYKNKKTKQWLDDRKQDLTSTDIASLFGVGRMTYEELLNHKRNKTTQDFQKNERCDWGLVLQDAIAGKFAEENNWKLKRMDEYIRIPDLRLGSSFDYEVMYEEEDDKVVHEILEIKNVDYFEYKKDWHQGFEIEAPAHIELQLQHQLLVSGFNVGYIGVLIGGNQGIVLKREANKRVHEAILKKAEKFWKEVNK